MASDPSNDPLVADLRALGRSVPTTERDPAGTALATAVMARLVDAPAPRPASRWRRFRHRAAQAAGRRRRRVLVVTAVVLLGCLGVPGVRAAVIDWFTFNGVSVHLRPAPGPSVPQAPPPPTAHGSSLDQARMLARFRPVRLTALGDPDGVEMSTDRRRLSLTWNTGDGGTTRLDQFDGALDYSFAKTSPDVEWTKVAGTEALWFEDPHEVVILDGAGTPRTETARLAGNTLIWERDGTVLRLEGDVALERAVEIAESAQALR